MDSKLLKKQEIYFYIMTNIYLLFNIYYLINSNKLIIKIILFLLAFLTILRIKRKTNKYIDYIEKYYSKISDKKIYMIFTYGISTVIFIFKILIVKLISII